MVGLRGPGTHFQPNISKRDSRTEWKTKAISDESRAIENRGEGVKAIGPDRTSIYRLFRYPTFLRSSEQQFNAKTLYMARSLVLVISTLSQAPLIRIISHLLPLVAGIEHSRRPGSGLKMCAACTREIATIIESGEFHPVYGLRLTLAESPYPPLDRWKPEEHPILRWMHQFFEGKLFLVLRKTSDGADALQFNVQSSTAHCKGVESLFRLYRPWICTTAVALGRIRRSGMMSEKPESQAHG
ncbi:hypothetical protein C8R43DRAFT_958790 [Mycena crocata]|nr:hypothetical protein C8R43DRAFT_958790 [Mycena crocata]